MRTFTTRLTVLLLGIGTATALETQQPADAYEIYSLLLPHEESYGFAKDALMIQENTIPEDMSGACLRQADTKRFKWAIGGYNRIFKTNGSCSGNFRSRSLTELYERKSFPLYPTIPKVLFHKSVCRQCFNREKTQAIVFVEAPAVDCVEAGGSISLRRFMASGTRYRSLPPWGIVIVRFIAMARNDQPTVKRCYACLRQLPR